MSSEVHPVDEMLPPAKLFTLGLQHVLVMYAGAIAVPLIIGRVLGLNPTQVAYLISADLFVCGLVTIIQSYGAGKFFGIRLPVMMGVTFASVGPMVSIGLANPGVEGARLIFGSIIGAGIIGMLIAPFVSRMLRFFPPVVTGTIILVIGVTLMRVGIQWIFGVPVGPTAPQIMDPANVAFLDAVKALPAGTLPELPGGFKIAPTVDNPAYASPASIMVSALVLVVILLVAKFAKGFFSNIAVLCGIVVGGIVAAMLGKMDFSHVADASWFQIITPFYFGMPVFNPVMIATMTLVMIVVMIESMGMFLALGEMTEKKITQPMMSSGLRTDGLGTLIGGIFNTFPYTSFSQNVGLVGVTGVKSRWVCIMGGAIMIVLGLTPKVSTLVEALPTAVLGGAGLVMFGMVAATGIRILSAVDFKGNKFNLFIVAISIGFGMIPLIAPSFDMWMPHVIAPLIDSGILLAAFSSVLLNIFFNGTSDGGEDDIKKAALATEGGH